MFRLRTMKSHLRILNRGEKMVKFKLEKINSVIRKIGENKGSRTIKIRIIQKLCTH